MLLLCLSFGPRLCPLLPPSCELVPWNPLPESESSRYLENIAHNRIGSKWSDLVSFCNPENERTDHFGKIGVPCGRLDVWGRPTEGPSLFIQWKLNIHTHRGEILGYNVTYNHGGTVHSEEVKSCHVLLPANSTDICVSARNIHGQGYPSCATHICKGKFAPYVAYQVSVFAIYHNDCAGLVSTTIYSQEGAPSTGPNFSIHLLSFTEALIVWEEIPVQYRRGFITNYTICLNRTEYIQRQTVLTATNYLFSGLLPNTAYTMWMTASTKAGEGPAGDIKTFQTGSASFSYALICAPIGFILLVGLGLVMCSQSVIRDVCWPNIPNLDISSAVMNSPQYNSMWDVDQVSVNHPIAIVEEIELPPPKPPQVDFIGSGYERHFLPTQEEVMGLC
ncbi:hypothetical protein GDO86_006990 [Hymenochirus boettgeri]|uniref:Fibronectin type-III domain-containing protein n=1 Tax=Hymenochirus boettgeri TaxID=247094 RepID=A0A8T2JD83_9PIPI|nr:hypothetical protein GDO86_006990 [Hymenochirus boettgeri]